jgi:hypothetical protein
MPTVHVSPLVYLMWQRLLQLWAGLNHGFIAAAIGQLRRRLSACVKAQGGHFEHLLC